jgi:SAM-dependent methyltransferase
VGSERAQVLKITALEDSALRDGHYATKQIFCKDQLIAWSHRRRFETGLELARQFAGRRILDYGCGDGTFLALLAAGTHAPAQGVGAELDSFQVEDCRARLGSRSGLRFESIAALDESEHAHRYDGVVCMEVLEHVVDLSTVIERLWRVLSTEGTLLVSVPVETGLPLLVKQTARRIAGWRGIGDYPGTSPYSSTELMASLFAGPAQHIERPVYGAQSLTPFHDHKGFNWMVLKRRLADWFEVQRVVASPWPLLGPHFATQVWLEAVPRDRTRAHLDAHS